MLKIGSLIDGKYKILSEIGHGGMSTVYLAINEKANKPWAIKEVRKTGTKNYEIVRQSLLMEIELLRKLKHPGLPSIIDIIDGADDFLIVMDYIEGNTLEMLVREEGMQKQEQVVNWAIQLCDVLTYLHTRNPPIVYRDMKPSNIMLRSDGSVVLIDFGTAREFKERNVADTVCLGTQGYAAPEQFGGMGQSDARTDIYCLGATMYHLLTGHNPSKPPYEMYPITKWNPTLSTGLEKILLKCTQKNPEMRYTSAKELKAALIHYKDYDESAMIRYKKKIKIFYVLCFMTVMLFMTGIGLLFTALRQKKDTYQYHMDAAGKAALKNEQIEYYEKAIDTDSSRKDAYQGLLDLFMEDALFDKEEEKVLQKLTVSVEKYMERLKNKHPEQYADVCYEIGNLYWFYYEHEENRQTNAVSWFENALIYYEKEPDKKIEWKRAKTYEEIGMFYKKILPAQISGMDKGMYGAYWRDLMDLFALQKEIPDRDIVRLRFYEEVVTKTVEYASYLKEDEVNYEEIEQVFTDIENDIKMMEQSQKISAEIEYVGQVMNSARKMLFASYKGGK